MFDDQDGCEWVNVSFGTSPQRAVERLCVRVIHFNICAKLPSVLAAVRWSMGRS